ncbi:TetR/AcrR family transcriptional regulator [Bradyrhizobium altum]|uniref:TetR/AcrR family transcriptional regulator n=1 Tax=Bradyrhizobium altum TaxID=1571202 RepID=UPI001E30CFE8|nr:TetR/AcrR family transcriptional regulator [Bradyrhizobium altum]
MTIVIILVKGAVWRHICGMRVSKEKAAENRDRILKAASRLLRERGISGVGVDTLTEAAGMTHGSLYSQFGSKERLVEEAVADAIAVKGQELEEVPTLGNYVSEYLSEMHRDDPGSGCPFAAWGCEMQRQSQGVRERFTAGVRGMVGWLGDRMGSGIKQRQRDEHAAATLASLVGAIVLARAVNDPKLADDILGATKKRLER